MKRSLNGEFPSRFLDKIMSMGLHYKPLAEKTESFIGQEEEIKRNVSFNG